MQWGIYNYMKHTIMYYCNNYALSMHTFSIISYIMNVNACMHDRQCDNIKADLQQCQTKSCREHHQ